MMITYIPAIAQQIAIRLNLPEPTSTIMKFSLMVLSWAVNFIVAIGMIKIALAFCDERKPPIGTILDFTDCFWRYAAVSILYILIMYAGFILLIVPGIIWGVKFGLCFYFVVDKGMGPIDALKASSRTTMGVKWNLFALQILSSVIIMAGLLCLLVGIFAAYPIVLIAYALVYRQLAAQTPDLDDLALAPEPINPQPTTDFIDPNLTPYQDWQQDNQKL
jgi:uncharacterized membrane protein